MNAPGCGAGGSCGRLLAGALNCICGRLLAGALNCICGVRLLTGATNCIGGVAAAAGIGSPYPLRCANVSGMVMLRTDLGLPKSSVGLWYGNRAAGGWRLLFLWLPAPRDPPPNICEGVRFSAISLSLKSESFVSSAILAAPTEVS